MVASSVARLPTPGVLSTLLPMAVVGSVGGLLSWQYQAGLRRERDLVAHTWEVISTAGDLLGAAADAETGQRGYVITGDPTYLAPYAAARSRLPGLVGRVRGLVADNPGQQGLLDQLRALTDRKLAELDEGIARRRDQGFDAARALVAEDAGKAVMDEARGVAAKIVRAEQDLLARRTADVRFRERWVVAVGLATALLSIATRGLVDAWLRRRRPGQPV